MIVKEITDCNELNDITSLMGWQHVNSSCIPEHFWETVQMSISSGLYRIWIAYEGGTPIGYISGVRQINNSIFIEDHYLMEEYRGVANDKMLMEKIIDWVIDSKAQQATWLSRKGAKFWDRCLKGRLKGHKVKLSEMQHITCEVL